MDGMGSSRPDVTRLGGIERRDFLKVFLAAGVSAVGLSPLLEACSSSNSGEPTGRLAFTAWSYGVSTVKSNIKKFEAKYPGVNVNFQDFSWTNYNDTMTSRFVNQTPTDVCYSSDHWLSQWASAKWIVPLGNDFSFVDQYKSDFFPYVLDGMTFDNALYGIPYYADTWAFLYNEDHLRKAGIAKPPTTWTELTDQAKQIKSKGVADFPVIMLFSQDDPGSIEVWMSMVYSLNNGHLFDQNLKPVFNRPGSAVARTIDWITSALNDSKILDPSSLNSTEIPVVKAMASGAHTFTILETYNQAELNKAGAGKYAGQFKMAEMPGETHNTVGYVRFYAATNQLVHRDKKTISDAGDFLQYFGGKVNGQFSPVVKRWAVENGLGFGWKSLWDDPDVDKAFGTWGDPAMLKKNQQLARVKEGLTKYFPQWETFTVAELQKAYTGGVSTRGAISAMANEWNRLKGQS